MNRIDQALQSRASDTKLTAKVGVIRVHPVPAERGTLTHGIDYEQTILAEITGRIGEVRRLTRAITSAEGDLLTNPKSMHGEAISQTKEYLRGMARDMAILAEQAEARTVIVGPIPQQGAAFATKPPELLTEENATQNRAAEHYRQAIDARYEIKPLREKYLTVLQEMVAEALRTVDK